jgi:hypothetical protein
MDDCTVRKGFQPQFQATVLVQVRFVSCPHAGLHTQVADDVEYSDRPRRTVPGLNVGPDVPHVFPVSDAVRAAYTHALIDEVLPQLPSYTVVG